MREARFIKQNADKWQRYQHSQTDNPDETADRFITLIDDLSYAKTFYPKSKVTRWINGIAAGIYQSIYQNKKEKYSRIFQFWKFELPLLFRRYHRIFLFTTIVFLLFVGIGIFSSMKDENFMRGILGNDYVNMTEDNIRDGDPFGVYKDGNPFTMFVRIAMNNIFVALMFVLGGFLLGIPTLFQWPPPINVAGLWSTGMMLGAFQYMFFAHGLGFQSVLVIWIHGTLEISIFVISATAGFIIASSMIFPGTFSRGVSCKRGIKDAVKILLVIIPILLLAAFFESYITHLMSRTYDKTKNGLPVWAGVLILAASAGFIIWYFIILPILLHRKGYYIQPDGIINRLKQENA
jgi:uncharacterized membrane protein SpoIIM required for sporulation